VPRREIGTGASPSFSFSSSTIALGRLLADAGNRLEAGGVLEHDRSAKLGRRRAGHDRERDLRPDAVDRQQLNEQLALAGFAKP
jgi:hypothetical protein